MGAQEPRIGRGGGLSAVWLLPLAALAAALWIAWTHFADQGPLITLRLDDASGVQAGRTPLRFRDVEIGRVEALNFDDGFEQVEAEIRVSPDAAARMGENTRFWVVTPQVSAAGVSGLETLLSGAYLGVDLSAEPEGARLDVYDALDAPPLTPADAAGARVTLVASDAAAFGPGAAITFKGVEVGRIETRRLAEDAARIEYDAFITAPYDAWVTRGARFWSASGFEFALDAEGAHLKVDSLASLLRGGVAFDLIAAGDGPPPERFTLYGSEKAARDSVFTDDPLASIRFTAAFEGSVRGLATGAPVEYRGVRIGAVEDMTVRAGDSAGATRIVVTLRMEPARIGFEGEDEGATLGWFARSVADGLKARLASGNLVTGALYVELVELPDQYPGAIDLSAEPYPSLPTTPSTLDELQATAQDVIARLSKLPIERLATTVIGAIENIERLTGDDSLQAAPAALTAMLEEARAAIAALNAETVGDRLASTLGSANAAAKAVEDATAALPGIARRLEAAAKAAEAAMLAYGPGSTVQKEAASALREVREAARAAAALAKALERRPNSIILGR